MNRIAVIRGIPHAVAAWRASGRLAHIHYFNGPGDSHGFGTTDSLHARERIPVPARMLREALHAPEKP